MDSPLTLEIYMKLFYFIVLVCYLKPWEVSFLTEKNRLLLPSRKWTESLLSTNDSHTFVNSLFKRFSISAPSLMLIKNASVVCIQLCVTIWQGLGNIIYIYVYSNNNKDPNIDPWVTPHFMVPTSKSSFSIEVKKALWDKNESISLFYP